MLFSDQNAKNKNCIRFDGCIARDKTGCLKLAGFVLLRGGGGLLQTVFTVYARDVKHQTVKLLA